MNFPFFKNVSFVRKDKQTKHPQTCSENKPFGNPRVDSRFQRRFICAERQTDIQIDRQTDRQTNILKRVVKQAVRQSYGCPAAIIILSFRIFVENIFTCFQLFFSELIRLIIIKTFRNYHFLAPL